MIIVETPEKNVSHSEMKKFTGKVRKYSVNYSSALFSYSIYAIYNRVHSYQKQLLMLKLYTPGVDPWIGVIICYNNYLTVFFQWITLLDMELTSCNSTSKCI